MTAVHGRHLLWDRLGRSLLPTYGARANAADSLLDLQRDRVARAQAQDALARSAARATRPDVPGPRTAP